MALPYFYIKDLSANTITLDENTSKHVIQVLRMKSGEALMLTDGKGSKAKALIVNDNRKRCEVKIESVHKEEVRKPAITIAVSLIKNASRFEWFLEKATEIGIGEIIPLLCERTEKEKFRFERLNGILVSAMLQSQQSWLPILHEPTEFKNVLKIEFETRFIAHCIEEEKQFLSKELSTANTSRSQIILIGPEGDFTPKEISEALQKGFVPVSLGHTRLRTETAALVAAVVMCNFS
jgi:16S rRNA (uracil1498-N3)-methyltransferase